MHETHFETLALELFQYQKKNVPVYRKYCELLGRTDATKLHDIPFLPIELFKKQQIIDKNYSPTSTSTALFLSSGTTGVQRSQHMVLNTEIYEISAKKTFESTFGLLSEMIVLALLPNYIEQGHSSLIYMVNYFVNETKDEHSGFYLEPIAFKAQLQKAKKTGKKIMVFGVSYALLDLAEMQLDLSGVYVIETGGMKGRRPEINKDALQQKLRNGLNIQDVYSEYGMTELLSQAYNKNNSAFVAPPWMSVLIREQNDPFCFKKRKDQRTGGVSVIDLANIHSCAFIHTQDLGQYEGVGFKLLGRFDNSDIRGCNQMID